MLVFAHTGIPLGIVWLAQIAYARVFSNQAQIKKNPVINTSDVNHSTVKYSDNKTAVRWLDYRGLLFGSILPDIVDKPLGTWFFRESLSNGRVFSHTLLFLLVLSIIGIYLLIFKKNLIMFSLAIGCLAHLCLDEMWLYQQTLLWPLYGFDFETKNISHWAQKVWESLLNEPAVYVPEIIGFFCIAVFLFILISRKQLVVFIKTGQIS